LFERAEIGQARQIYEYNRAQRIRDASIARQQRDLDRKVGADPPIIFTNVPGGIANFNPRVRNITRRLQMLAWNAARHVDRLGDRAFTPDQRAAIQRHPEYAEILRALFRGNRIDVMVRRDARFDRDLRRLQSNYSRGPDFVDPETGVWWDITTYRQWQPHVRRYGARGVLTPAELD
jgi:hypothetical protein